MVGLREFKQILLEGRLEYGVGNFVLFLCFFAAIFVGAELDLPRGDYLGALHGVISPSSVVRVSRTRDRAQDGGAHVRYR